MAKALKKPEASVIRYGNQHITEEDISAVVDVLKSDFLTQGPKIKEFEEKFARYVGSKFAVAVSNGTAALHMSNMALGVNTSSRIITTPITFVASANGAQFCGAKVYFADVDRESKILNIESVRSLLASKPKGFFSGIIAVDFAGYAANLEEFRGLAAEYGLWIIEDACHSPGGYFTDSKGKQQRCGNGNYADLAIFSFHPVKHIACGEGGMVTTNDETLYKKLLTYRSHGITSTAAEFQNDLETALVGNQEEIALSQNKGYPRWYMEMQNLGYNYRITDIQAALGISQLSRAQFGVNRRRELAQKYNEAFKDCGFLINQSGVVEGHAYHLYIIQVHRRLELFNYLIANEIFVQIHYYPAHLMPYYRLKKNALQLGDLPNAENYYSNCVSLPMYPTLSNEQQIYVINLIKDFYNE